MQAINTFQVSDAYQFPTEHSKCSSVWSHRRPRTRPLYTFVFCHGHGCANGDMGHCGKRGEVAYENRLARYAPLDTCLVVALPSLPHVFFHGCLHPQPLHA